MNQNVRRALALIVCAAFLWIPGVSAEGSVQNWYCKKVTDHRRPECPFSESLLRANEAYFLGPDEKTVYLTFDAGYSNANVESICRTLKEHNVSGTFFVLKHFVEANPDLVKALTDNGNLIGNHTLHHPNVAKLSKEELKQEILGMEECYRAVTGQEMAKFFRPPEGSFNEASLKTVKELGYKTVFWSVAYADWDNNKQPSEEEAMEKLLSRVHNGAVILLHPTSQTNAAILGRLITQLKAQGYRFGSLEELK